MNEHNNIPSSYYTSETHSPSDGSLSRTIRWICPLPKAFKSIGNSLSIWPVKYQRRWSDWFFIKHSKTFKIAVTSCCCEISSILMIHQGVHLALWGKLEGLSWFEITCIVFHIKFGISRSLAGKNWPRSSLWESTLFPRPLTIFRSAWSYVLSWYWPSVQW